MSAELPMLHGLYMVTCAWNMDTMKVVDALPGDMSAELHMLLMEPQIYFVPDQADYMSPMYKTTARAETHSTTGKRLELVFICCMWY
jgi:dynein heavy chain